MLERTFIASRGPKISSALRPSTARRSPTHSRSLAPEDRVRKVGARLVERADGEMLGHRAASEAGDLGKDEPDPVAGLSSSTQLSQDGLVVAVLLRDEPLQIVRHGAGDRCSSIWRRRSERISSRVAIAAGSPSIPDRRSP